jgi:hypothetical protein
MSTLGDSQRRIVQQGGFDLFCPDHPPAKWQLRLVNGFTILIACVLSFGISHQFLFRLLIGAVVLFVIQIFFQSLLTERLRPYFRSYIAAHSDEIDRAV